MSATTGTFIIREKNDNQLVLSVSVLEGSDVVHYRVHQQDDGGFYISTCSRFSTLHELIAHHQHDADGLPVKLSKPLLRIPTSEQPYLHHDLKELSRSNISLTEILQRGEFSDIWKGRLREGDKSMSVSIHLPNLGSKGKKNTFEEAIIMNGLCHPNIIRIHGICCKENKCLIVTECIEDGSLFDYLQKKSGKSLKVIDVIAISAQVASGMAYLEKKNIVHRDLVSWNVFMAERNIVKIGRFSLARSLPELGAFVDTSAKVAIQWMPLEVLIERKFSTKSDVWSFGILLYQMITHGRPPYPGMSNEEVVKKMEKGYRLPKPVRCPQWLYKIMLDCWEAEPDDRPTFYALQYSLSNIAASFESDTSWSHFSRIKSMLKH